MRHELHQISGLSAGNRFAVGPSGVGIGLRPDEVGFEIHPDPAGPIVRPRRASVRLDGMPITEPTLVGESIIDAGSGLFTIRQSSGPDEPLATRHLLGPDPVALAQAAGREGGMRWSRRRSDARFDSLVVAHVGTPWQAVTAHLTDGPIGLVGPRPHRLAAARALVTSLAVLCEPDDMELAVLAGPSRAADWRWADGLPHTAPGVDQALPVLVVDGPEHLDSELGLALTESGGIGAIVLSERLEDILGSCAMAINLDSTGSATIIDRITGQTRLGAIPIGISATQARSMTSDLLLAARANGNRIRRPEAAPTTDESDPRLRYGH